MTRAEAVAYVLALGEAFANEYATSTGHHVKVATDTAAALHALGVDQDAIDAVEPADIVDDLYASMP